jgi:hypothetical protein
VDPKRQSSPQPGRLVLKWLMPWYEWAFSGIGATLLGGVGFLVRRALSKSQAATLSVSAVLHSVSDSNVAVGNNVSQQIVHHHHVPNQSLESLKASEPSPAQIMAALFALPPFGRHQAAESYQGLPVLWPLTLLTIVPYRSTWAVMFKGSTEPHPFSTIVHAHFPELPPEIRISPADTLVWIRGRIREVDPLSSISLEADPEIVEVRRL